MLSLQNHGDYFQWQNNSINSKNREVKDLLAIKKEGCVAKLLSATIAHTVAPVLTPNFQRDMLIRM